MLDVLEMLTRDYSEAETRASENRLAFPFFEPWKEELERAFGPVKVTNATNGMREVGDRFEDRCRREGHTPCAYWPNGVAL
jgi:hypothetical protein